MRRATVLAGLLLVSVPTPFQAQAPGVTSPSNEVSLYPSVRVRKANALRDLTAADLSIHDGASLLDPHEVRLASTDTHPLVTLIFDRLDATDQRRSAIVAGKLLKGLDLTAAPVALWHTGTRLRILSAYTSDRALLGKSLTLLSNGTDLPLETAAAEQQHRLAEPAPQPIGSAPSSRELLDREVALASLQRADELTGEQHLPSGIAALFAAADTQRSLPGRKVVVLFTESMPSGPGAAEMLRSLTEQLTSAGISLYLIDVRVLDRTATQDMAAAIAMGTQTANTRNNVQSAVLANPRDSRSYTLSLGPATFTRMHDSVATMELGGLDLNNRSPLATLASDTGGAASNLNVDTGKLTRVVAEDLRSNLRLTLPVPSSARDGSYHAIVLASSAKGVTIASPLGYFADPSTLGARSASLTRRTGNGIAVNLQELRNGASANDLALRGGLHHSASSSSARTTELAIQVPVAQLELRRDNTTHLLTLNATVAAQLVNSEDKVVAGWTETFHKRGALESEAEVRTTSLTLRRPLALPPGEYQLHAVVRDWLADRSGELNQPLTLTAEAAPDPDAPALAGAPHADAPDLARQAARLEMLETSLVETGLTAAPPHEPPTAAQIDQLIGTARSRALNYADSLPNFLCIEHIDRSVDPRGTGIWKHRDALVELLRYKDKRESRSMVEINGQKSSVAAEQIDGARSNGEFGGILSILFAPEAGTTFTYLKTMEGEGEPLEVFGYKLSQPASQYFVTDGAGQKLRAGLHGFLYLDAGTGAVRRILAQTEPLPQTFGLHASWMAIEYSYLSINNHDYLLPIRGEVGLQQRRGALSLLQLRFSDYRRFGSHTTIHYGAAELQPTSD